MPREVLATLSLGFIANMSYWQLPPFYPDFLTKKGIDPIYLGYVMSTFAVMFILSAFFNGRWLLHKIDRVEGCFLGAAIVVSTTYLLT